MASPGVSHFARLVLLLPFSPLIAIAAPLERQPAPLVSRDPPADDFSHFNQSFSSLQSQYWQQYTSVNGTWPSSIAWTAALTSQLTSASIQTYLQALTSYKDLPDDQHASVMSSVGDMYQSLPSFFTGEDIYSPYYWGANDDKGWLSLAWLEAYGLAGAMLEQNPSFEGANNMPGFSQRAYMFYDQVAQQWDPSTCAGGVTWKATAEPYKNSITNQLFLATTMAMYFYFPGYSNTSMLVPNGTTINIATMDQHDPSLLGKAKEIYNWIMSSNMTNAQGLFIDGYHLTNGVCDQADTGVYTYNQGVILDGMRSLYDATGDLSYLSDGYNLINNVIHATGYNTSSNTWAGLGGGGIMQDWCDRDGSCNQNAQTFKAVFWLNFAKFCAPITAGQARVPGVSVSPAAPVAQMHQNTCASYRPWAQLNAAAALASQDADGLFGQNWASADLAMTKRDMASVRMHAPLRVVQLFDSSAGLDVAESDAQVADPAALRSAAAGADALKVNAAGRGRTVETQDGGLAVVRAYYQLMHMD